MRCNHTGPRGGNWRNGTVQWDVLLTALDRSLPVSAVSPHCYAGTALALQNQAEVRTKVVAGFFNVVNIVRGKKCRNSS